MKFFIWIVVIFVPSVIPSITCLKLNSINILYSCKNMISLSKNVEHEYIPKKGD